MKIIFYVLIIFLNLRKLFDLDNHLNPNFANALMKGNNYYMNKNLINYPSHNMIRFNFHTLRKNKFYAPDIKYNFNNNRERFNNNVNTDFYLWLNNLSGSEFN